MPTTGNRWPNDALSAAVVNAALVVLVPVAWLTYTDYTWDAVRPVARTLPSSAAYALRTLLVLFPISLLVGWRTYVHARVYWDRPTSAWRGPLESAALAGGIALLLMLTTMVDWRAWTTRPPLLVAAYIAFYVIGTAIVGLLLGIMLAGTALLVLHLSRAVARTKSHA